jgi:hypothetical protein
MEEMRSRLCQADVVFVRIGLHQGTVVHRLILPPKSGKVTPLNRRKITDTCTTRTGCAASDGPDGRGWQQGFVRWKTGTDNAWQIRRIPSDPVPKQ